MGLPCVARVGTVHGRWRQILRSSSSTTALVLSASLLLAAQAALADVDTGTTVKISTLSGTSTTMNGGTVQFDASKTYSRDFTFNKVSTNTFDLLGSTSTISGQLSGDGPITIGDSTGGGILTLSNTNNDYTGITTINSGATLALIDTDTSSTTNTDSGSIQYSQQLVANGTFDISGTASGTSIIALAGSGKVVLGSETLTIYNYDSKNEITYDTPTTFSGVISGKGGLVLSAGELTLSGVNTLTGSVTVSSGTLHLSGNGSISSASTVYAYGTLDFSSANSAVIKSLGGSGTVKLGSNDLVITAAGNTFSGVISGTGGLVLNSGTQYLTGDNTFTGNVTVNGGTLEVGSETVAYNVANSGTFAFYTSSTLAMNGVISGSGDVTSIGTGVSTISLAQTYTGATTITSGTIKLSGAGSIANSSLVTINGVLDVSETTAGATLKGIAGTGTLRLGEESLILTGSGAGDFSGTITGTGSLTLNGGKQTLSGASTYTGVTTVSGGTLYLSAGASLRSMVIDNSILDISTGTSVTGSATITSLSGNGSVVLGSNTLVMSNASTTFDGVISGAGGIWVSGGTQTLSGTNTYTGSTTVSSGTLVLSSTGSISSSSKLVINGTFDASSASGTSLSYASLSGTGNVKVGSHALTLTDASGSFSGVLQGTGGLTISGGTQILAGTNTYTGGTTVASGATLQLGNGGITGSVVGDIVDNGTLAFNRGDSSVFSGVISGSGALSQSGVGTIILTGTNTYTGGTTISGGVLQIGNGGTSGSLQGNVVDNGTLAFSRSDGTLFSGVISGTGAVAAVSGTATLTGVNTYTGLTNISNGAALALSGSGSIADSSKVQADGTFDVSAAATPSISSLAGAGSVVLGTQTLTITDGSTTFSGIISGSGGLTVSGGTQVLSGTNTYTGATTIGGGTLSVTGSIASSSGVSVNSGGTLSGTGTVSALTVNSGGTVSAGTSGSGSLSVNGNVSFASGSTYVVSVASETSTSLSATGTASLAGTLEVASTDGTYVLGTKTAVLTAAGGVNGKFSLADVESSGATFVSVLSYDASHVYLTIDLAKLSPLLPTTATANQSSVIYGLDKGLASALANNTSAPAKIQNLGNDTSAVLAANADQLSGELGSDLPLVTRAISTPFLNAMFSRVASQVPGGAATPVGVGGVDTWTAVLGSTNVMAGDDSVGSHKFRADMAGVVFGANWSPWRNVVLGAAVSVDRSDFHLENDLGKGHATAYQAGFYGYLQPSSHFYNAFAVAGTYSQIKTDRLLTVDGTDNLTASLNAYSFGGRYEAGILLGWLTPYIAAQDLFSSLPSYSENASSGTNAFALQYSSRNVNAASVELGIRHQLDIEVTPRWLLTPDWLMHITDRIAWAHDFSGGSTADVSFANLSDTGFTVHGARLGHDAVLASVGADFLFANGFSINSRLDTAFTSESQSFTGYAGVAYRW